jgi:hypothetical protein
MLVCLVPQPLRVAVCPRPGYADVAVALAKRMSSLAAAQVVVAEGGQLNCSLEAHRLPACTATRMPCCCPASEHTRMC